MEAEGIVISVTPDVFWRESMGIYVARVLGLTAYGGATPDTALLKLERMLTAFIRAHKAQGTLEKYLNDRGLEWRTK